MNMPTMADVIVPKSDQINADDLISGPITITIREVQIKGGQEQPVSIYFDGSDKAFRPCKSMSRVLVAAWGPDAKQYVGRSLTLYRDPTVKWGGMEVGGIRISHMTHIDAPMTMALTATKGSRKPYTVKPLAAEVRQHPGGEQRQRQTPEQWASDHIAQIATASTLPDVDALIAKGKRAVEKLASEHPDLREKVMDAYSARINALEAEAAAAQPDATDDAFAEG